MKKKELKRIIKELEAQNAELRLTRYNQGQDIRVLLGNDEFKINVVKAKYNLLSDIESNLWQGEYGIDSNGFLDSIKTNINENLV